MDYLKTTREEETQRPRARHCVNMYRLLLVISLVAAVSAGRSSHNSDDEEDTTTHCADWDETRTGMIMAGKEGYGKHRHLLQSNTSHLLLMQLPVVARTVQKSAGTPGAKPTANSTTFQPGKTQHVFWTRISKAQFL